MLSYRAKSTDEARERLVPDSILFSIFLAHCMKASSTFSPVSALVSRNMSSTDGIKEERGPQLADGEGALFRISFQLLIHFGGSACHGVGTVVRGQFVGQPFLLPAMWATGMKLGSSCLEASAFVQ